MLKIDSKYVQMAQSATELCELHFLVQKAIELEHSTIPPYLTAMYSLIPRTNIGVRTIIHSIVVEEMLHMTISANILNALGGKPKINTPDFVPEYPGNLPMGIGGSGFIVGLEMYSKDLVKNIFMEIEEPETPIIYPTTLMAKATLPTFSTIGIFYKAIQAKIEEIAPDTLPGDPALQVTSNFFASNLLYPILTKEDAINAINIIIDQGEGTDDSPLDEEGELAHYYRFEELYYGRKLVKSPLPPYGYSFTGASIAIDTSLTGVYPLFPNTKTAMLPDGSEAKNRMNEFNSSYYSLLAGLHDVFNGKPNDLDKNIGTMYDIKLAAEKLCAMPFPDKEGYHVGPSFEYVSPTAFLLS
ncbi:ferritin-like protein [Arcicella sp. LKC2W]|uniref:ferritin-like domain-containing protein n=1 Tax=Arcicella sp. LKC2W TaxID=2984198 RepID=UPI002B215E0E|nr:ferritin-like protein [Arcicella sp. LKC2W]MEA5460765.1 ferritin-like protein [Arcicella sp. LKC2W]